MYHKLHLDSKEEEAHASFLVSAANYANSISSRALKSHLNILSHETLRMKNFARGKRFKKSETCQYCLTNWKNGEFSLKVLPVSKKQQRMKKLFRNIAKNKPLVKIEEKLADARNIKNILLVKCLVCTKETKFKLRGAYTLMGAGERKTSMPGLPLRSAEKKMKKKARAGMNMKQKKSSSSRSGVNSDRVGGFPSQQASEGNSNQKKSPGVGQGISQNEDEDEIEIMYESHPPEKKRTLDYIELDQEKPAKKRKKKKTKKTASHEFGVLSTPSSTPYNTPGDATYNTPLSVGCATPYNMQYNTPYGIPYSIEYGTPYNNQTYATPYNASYNSVYDETYANYGNYSAADYIPLDTGADTSKKKRKRKKKKKGAFKNQNLGSNDSGKDLILNPFCDKVREICNLPRKKKLNRWKQLISEEENKPTQSTSFKDFLDKLKRG